MSWMVKKEALLPNQRNILNLIAKGENCFIKGEAGTGKSIVLVHAAIECLIANPEIKICMLTFTNALVSCLAEGLDNPKIPVMTVHKFMKFPKTEKFDCIFVDEVQDLEPGWAFEIKRRSKRVVVFGDFKQQLYEDRLEQDEMKEIFGIKFEAVLDVDCRLPLNHRKMVMEIHRDRKFDARVYRLLSNAQIPIYHASNWDEEIDFVIEKAKINAKPGSPTAILFENKRAIYRFFYSVLGQYFGGKVKLETINDELKKRDLPFRFFGGGEGDLKESDSKKLVYVMTWHSSKGLDFDTVILPDIGRSTCRYNPFYVALTRSRRNLILTYSGKGNEQIEKAKRCPAVVILARNAETNQIEPQPKSALMQGYLF